MTILKNIFGTKNVKQDDSDEQMPTILSLEKDNEDKNDTDFFIELCKKIENPRVLELGTKRAREQFETKHGHFVPHAKEFLGTDISDGIDVDFVADAHKLSEVAGEEQFDIIISCSTFEHFKYPHLAAHEILKTLKVGGLLFIQTHQSFPLHAYPYDYFRFSREALASLFGEKMGFKSKTSYEFPAQIHSVADPGGKLQLAYLNSVIYGQKITKTPSEFIYEFDG